MAIGFDSIFGILGDHAMANNQYYWQGELNKQAAQLNYHYNEQSANNAFERQKAMYDIMFENNTPKNQVQRLKDAGLSVGLMYGGAGTTGGAQATTAPQGAGSAGSAIPGRAPSSTDKMMAAAQITAIGLQAAKLKSEIKVNETKAEEQSTAADANRASIPKMGADTENTQVDTELKKIHLNLEQETFAERVTAATLQNEATRQHIEATSIGIEQTKKQIELMTAQIAETMSSEQLNILEKAWRNTEIQQGWAKIAVAKEQVETAKDSNSVQRERQSLDETLTYWKGDLDKELTKMGISQKDRIFYMQKLSETIESMRGINMIKGIISGSATTKIE